MINKVEMTDRELIKQLRSCKKRAMENPLDRSNYNKLCGLIIEGRARGYTEEDWGLGEQEKTILKKAGGHAAMAQAKKLVEEDY